MQKYIKYVGPTSDTKLQYRKHKTFLIPNQLVIKIFILVFILGLFALSTQNFSSLINFKSNFVITGSLF